MHDKGAITLVIVAYERELDMLALLARSVDVHVAENLLAEILIIDNSTGQLDFSHRIKARILPALGRYSEICRVLAAKDLNVTVTGVDAGYTSQQALKLEVSRVVSTEYYLLMDAKNHLVRRLGFDDLFASDGRPFVERTIHQGYLATCQRRSYAFWGMTPVPDAVTLPTVTPYLMISGIVRRMLNDIERQGHTVQEIIAADDKRTEFLLYAGYLEREGTVDTAYAHGARASATLYARWPQDESTIERVISSAGKHGSYAMGVHSKRFKQLKPAHARLLAEKWVEVGLFDSVEDGTSFIRGQVREEGTAVNDVLIGRGRRLSIEVGTNGLLQQHRGEKGLSKEDAAMWRRTMSDRASYCRARGADYAMLIAPDTYSLFAEDFLDFGLDSHLRPAAQVLSDIPQGARVVYPLDALRAARDGGIIAHTADSHWSAYGALVAYRSLASALPGVLREFGDEEIEFSHRVGSGDLGDKLDPRVCGEYTEAVLRHPSARQVWNNGVNNRGYMGLWVNDSPNLPRGILFMDSYGWKFQRFLAESFSTLMVVHSPYLERDPINDYAPDVVINLMAERFMIRVPDDDTSEPALITAISKLPSARYPTRNEYETGIVASSHENASTPESAAPTRADDNTPPELTHLAPQHLSGSDEAADPVRTQSPEVRDSAGPPQDSRSGRGVTIEELRNRIEVLEDKFKELEDAAGRACYMCVAFSHVVSQSRRILNKLGALRSIAGRIIQTMRHRRASSLESPDKAGTKK